MRHADSASSRVLRYRASTIPDRTDAVLRVFSGGDVMLAIRECHEHLLRTLVTYPPGTATLVLRWLFTPATRPSERQSRLTLVVMVWGRSQSVVRNLRVLIECSDLALYYGLEEWDTSERLFRRPDACCDITRREYKIQPLHSVALNPAIPPVYYLCDAFSPRPLNDYLLLDRVLDRVSEQVMFEVAVAPVDLRDERVLHTRSLANLQSINRPYELDAEDDPISSDPFEPGVRMGTTGAAVIKPLRRRDPVADDILRDRRRLHEELKHPHLRFHLRVLTRTSAVARLVASIIAESAFERGSYSLWLTDLRSTERRRLLASSDHAQVYTQSTLERVLGEHASYYQGFNNFAHVATVDQLRGAFTMPVAGRSLMRCHCRSTDPAPVVDENLFMLGHDE